MSPEQFYTILSNPDLLIQFLKQNNVISSVQKFCESCNKLMTIRTRKRKDGNFSYLYRCSKCKNDISIFNNTFFATNKTNGVSQKLSINTLLKLIFEYFEHKTHDQIRLNCGIKDSHTIVNWTNYVREVMMKNRNEQPKMGGIGRRVQIDESLFRGRRKYHRGRLLLGDLDAENNDDRLNRGRNYGDREDGPWIFGLVEEGTNDVRMFYVERRNSETLHPIIFSNVELGTIIVSDGWKAYSRLNECGFGHEVVIHDENFVDPITGANTQRIECEWSHAKHMIMRKRRGTTIDLLQSHLDEFCFRKKYPVDTFIEWLRICNSIIFN